MKERRQTSRANQRRNTHRFARILKPVPQPAGWACFSWSNRCYRKVILCKSPGGVGPYGAKRGLPACAVSGTADRSEDGPDGRLEFWMLRDGPFKAIADPLKLTGEMNEGDSGSAVITVGPPLGGGRMQGNLHRVAVTILA